MELQKLLLSNFNLEFDIYILEDILNRLKKSTNFLKSS